MNNELIYALDRVVSQYSPLVSEKLEKALSEKRARQLLDKGKVVGDIECIVDLYTWKNGILPENNPTETPGVSLMSIKSFFPKDVYYFLDFKRACIDFNALKEVAVNYSFVKSAVGRYFPLFWSGRSGWIAVDLEPQNHNRIVYLSWNKKDFPLRELYNSFDDLILDAINAHKENTHLSCFQTDWKPFEVIEFG